MAESKRKSLGSTILGWLIAAVLVAAPLVYFLYLRETVIDVTVTVLGRGPVEKTVSAIASGTVKPHLDSLVASSGLGKIVRIPFDEGARVQEGDVLMELEHADLDAQVALAEANRRAGQSRLEQARIAATIYEEIARTRVSQASAQLELARTDFERVRSLSDKKAVSQSDLDKISLALRVAQENDAAAKASARENEVRQEEIKMAMAGLEQLDAAVRVAEELRAKAFVKAPFAGVIAKVPVEIGQAVTPGMPVVMLVQDEGFYVKAPFDEANASQILLGQTARVTLDAYRDEVFPGTVDFISPVVSLNPDLSRTMDINVKIDEGKEKFLAGMSADVVLLVERKEDVLYVPSEALIREEVAYVVDKGRAVKRNVKVGIGNFRNKEVLEGLKDGETLITSVTLKGLKDGIKVRVVDELPDE